MALNVNFPTYYYNDYQILKLSASAFRAHDFLMGWSVANFSDGVLPLDVAEFVHKVTTPDIEELLRAGLLSENSVSYQLVRYSEFNESSLAMRSSLENRKASDRVRQQKYRNKKREELETENKELGLEETPHIEQSRYMSRDNHVTNSMSRDNHVSSVSIHSSDNGNSNTTVENENSQHDYTTWDVAPIPADESVDTTTGEIGRRTCKMPGCDVTALSGYIYCQGHKTGLENDGARVVYSPALADEYKEVA